VTAAKLKVLLLMAVAVAAVSLGEALLAKGMKQSNALTGSLWLQLRSVLGNGHVLAGTALMLTFFGLYLLALRWADLSFVLPLTAVSYLADTLLAKHFLGETVSPARWLGVAIITLGVIIVGCTDVATSPSP
jgi:uncharacterized membrane protein